MFAFRGVFGCENPLFYYFIYEKGDLVRSLAILE